MMGVQRMLLAFSLLGAPAGTAVAQAVPSTIPSRAQGPERLADLLVAEKDVIDTAAGNFDQSFNAVIKARLANSTAKPSPQLMDAIRASGRRETMAILHEGYPELRRIVIDRFRTGLTPSEIADANAFYASPTGRRMNAAATANARGRGAEAIAQNMVDGVVGAMGPEDAPAIRAFGSTSAAAKMQILSPQLQQASVNWATNLMNANGARLQRATQTAAQTYLSAHRTRPAK